MDLNMSMGQKLILAFVTIIIGVVLIAVVAGNTLAVTTTSDTINESHNLVASGCILPKASGGQVNDSGIGKAHIGCNFTVTEQIPVWKEYECPITSVTIHNSTGGQSWTAGTDYEIWLDKGLVQMLNTTDTWEGQANTTYADYTACPDNYLTESWSRSLLNLVAGFLAIAMLGVGIGLFYSVFKDAKLG